MSPDAVAYAPRAVARRGRISGGLALLLAMTVVVMFTNDSAREYLKVPLGSFHLIERDFFLYGLLALLLMTVGLTRRPPRVGRFGACALAVAGLYYLYVFVGWLRGNEIRQMFFHLRQVNYVLVCFPFMYFVDTRRDLLAFLRVALGCALVAAALTFLLALRHAHSEAALRNEFLWLTGGAHGRYFHVRLAGAFFFVIVMDCLIALWVLRSRALSRGALAFMIALIGGAMVLTVLRSLWVGMAASLAVMWLVIRKRVRFLLISAAVVMITGAVLFGALGDTQIGRYVREQAQSAWDPESIAVVDRLEEHRVGIEKVAGAPWFGHGLGATIVVYLRSIESAVKTSFCHDSFLTLLIFFGVFGCAFLAAVFFAALREGVRVHRESLEAGRRFDAAIAIGCVAGVVGLLAMSVTAAALNYGTGFFLTGTVLGVLDRLDRLGHESEDDRPA